jgi:hypothetical protein
MAAGETPSPVLLPELSPTGERAFNVVLTAEEQISEHIQGLRAKAELPAITGYGEDAFSRHGEAGKLRKIADLAHAFAILDRGQEEAARGQAIDTEAKWAKKAFQEVQEFGASGQKLEDLNATAAALHDNQLQQHGEIQDRARKELERDLPGAMAAMERLSRMEAAIPIWQQIRDMLGQNQAVIDLAEAQIDGRDLALEDLTGEAQAAAATIKRCDETFARIRDAAEQAAPGSAAILRLDTTERDAALEKYRARAQAYWQEGGEESRLAKSRKVITELKDMIPVPSAEVPASSLERLADNAIREAWSIMEPEPEQETAPATVTDEINGIHRELSELANRTSPLNSGEQQLVEEDLRVLIELAEQVPDGRPATVYESADRLVRQILGPVRYAEIEDEYSAPESIT